MAPRLAGEIWGLNLEIVARLKGEMKESLKEGDRLKVSTIRLLLSEIKNEEIKKQAELEEAEVHQIISRQMRRRDEASSEYRKAGRDDLAEREEAERRILEEYMPAQLSDEEVAEVIRGAIEEAGASSVRELGKVMGKVMPELRGKADGKRVSDMAKEILEGKR